MIYPQDFIDSLTNENFAAMYFVVIDPIWQAFKKGELSSWQREQLLEPHRQRLAAIRSKA